MSPLPYIDPNAPGEVVFGLRGSSSAHSAPIPASVPAEAEPEAQSPVEPEEPMRSWQPTEVDYVDPEDEEDALIVDYRRARSEYRRIARALDAAERAVEQHKTDLEQVNMKVETLKTRLFGATGVE